MKLSDKQRDALELLKKHSVLDYNKDIYGFSAPGVTLAERIQMATAKALVDRGLAVAARTQEFRGKRVIDQLSVV